MGLAETIAGDVGVTGVFLKRGILFRHILQYKVFRLDARNQIIFCFQFFGWSKNVCLLKKKINHQFENGAILRYRALLGF